MRVGKLRTQRLSAFTMVEIALSIAVVAFALVAILGVLPTGMTVQKDNRDDSIINQEGRFWLEAIRSSARGIEDITNHVESITISNVTRANRTLTIDNGANGILLRPVDIIALLSTPKYLFGDTNRVTARVKSITGPAAEKGPLTNEFSFRYEMQVELTPVLPGPDDPAFAAAMAMNLHELRLIFRWPVVQRGNGWLVGNSRKTFRARVAGSYLVETNVTKRVNDMAVASLRTNLMTIIPNRFNVDLR